MPNRTSPSPPSPSTRPVRAAAVASAALAGVLLLAACGDSADASSEAAGSPAEAVAAAGPVPLVDADEALALVEDGATLVDVRTPVEFAAGHVSGAVNIDVQSGSFAEQVAALDPETTYVVYCVSGNRSGQATVLMQDQGLTRLHDAGAFDALAAAGADITTG